jgi:hypothetical protein
MILAYPTNRCSTGVSALGTDVEGSVVQKMLA